jgi:GNAT superfamily N-acetyltransferase
VIIREATIADLPEIIRMLADDELGAKREVFTEPLLDCYRNALAEIQRDPNNELLVAELDRRVIGTFQLTFITGISHQGGKIAQIEAVRIASDLRGKGFGAKMIEWAVARSRQKGCYRMQLTTNKIRKDAHRFYRRLGFSASHEGMKLLL